MLSLQSHSKKSSSEENSESAPDNGKQLASLASYITQLDIEKENLSSLIEKPSMLPEYKNFGLHEATASKPEFCESSNDSDPTEQFIPSETVTKEVAGEDVVDVGGCILHFPAGAFSAPQTVTITAEVDSRKWPPGWSIISPTLIVDTKNLQKSVTVRLPIWCGSVADDENAWMEVLRYCEEAKVWETVGEAQKFQGANFIEFKCNKFSWFTVAFRRLLVYAFNLRPVLYYSRTSSNLCSALIIDTPLHKWSFLKKVKKMWGTTHVQVIEIEIQPGRKDLTVKTQIECGEYLYENGGQTSFEALFQKDCAHSARKMIRTGSVSFNIFALPIAKQAARLSIIYKINTSEDEEKIHSFNYDFQRNEEIDQVPRNQVHPNIISTEGGDVHIGSRATYAGPIQTNVPGRMETRNTNCQDSMTIQNPPPQRREA